MEFANRSPGGSSQHHGNSCPYLAQSQHRPMPPAESFHGHAFGWGLPGQHPAPYHQWPAPPPPATLEIPPSSQNIAQLRAPSTAGLDPYQFLPGTLPPPQQQHHQHQPAGFRPGASTETSFGGRGGLSSGGSAPAPAASSGARTFNHHHAQSSRLPGQGPTPPSHLPQPAPPPHGPPSLQSQEQTQQPAAPSHHTPPHSNQAPQHPPPANPPTFSHHQHSQGESHPPPSASSFSPSSPADSPSLLSQHHQQLQQHQRYQSSMSSSNPAGSGGAPPPNGRPAQADPPGQYQNASGQATQEQRQRQQQQQQQAQSQDSQSYRHHPNPAGSFQHLGGQPSHIPPHLPSLLNPNYLQHQYGHGYPGAYSENISTVPSNQRGLPRLAPPNVPPTSDNRRRPQSTRSTRRTGTQAVPVSSGRDLDVDDESSPASSPGSSVDHAINAGATRHGPNDRQLRAAQVFRGSVSSKKVASSNAIASLQSVDVQSLSAAERSCVICYNDFGTETPEGVREAPLRLPKCRHVFGDHCIKKWFEESDSCPYCRTKVPSELRFVADARALMDLMRARGGTLPADLSGPISQEAILRLVSSPGASGHEVPGGTRRSPPSEGGENRRRIRPRHSGTVSSTRGDTPAGGSARPSSFSAIPSSSSHSPSSRDRHLADFSSPSLRAQDREREWAAMSMSHAGARQSQPRVPHGFYNPYWEESQLADPSGRLPMPPAGALPPMHAFPPQHSEQQNSLHRAAPAAQPPQPGQAAPYSYMQSMGLRSQRDAGAAVLSNFSPPTNALTSAEANASAVDTDTPMPDRGAP